MPGVADEVGETSSRSLVPEPWPTVSLFRNGVQPEALRLLVPAAGLASQGWLVRSPPDCIRAPPPRWCWESVVRSVDLQCWVIRPRCLSPRLARLG